MLQQPPNLPTYISIKDASHLTGLPVRALRERIAAGIIRAITINGEMAVSKQSAKRVADIERVNEQLKLIGRDQFKRLRGHPITIAEASKEYDVPSTTIRDWIKSEYVGIVADKHPVELDHADMAYCVAIYKVRHDFGIRRVPLLDDAGQPYQLKRPDVAEYRRRKRETLVVE